MNRLRTTILGGLCLLLGAGSQARAQASESAAAQAPTPPTSATSSSAPREASLGGPVAHKASAPSSLAKRRKSRRSVARARSQGQQKIDPKRTQEIQLALIREHYLSGQASGNWDEETEQALRRFQADNKWQSKTVPDARALIKLGLGPGQEHLLNPESAMTAPGPAASVLQDSNPADSAIAGQRTSQLK